MKNNIRENALNGISNKIFVVLCFFVFALISRFSSAQQTCASRKEAGEATFIKYNLGEKKGSRKREVVLYCTEKENLVRVVLRDVRTKYVLQSFHVTQEQTYLEASTPDLDKDGYSDLVLVTAWGSPNLTFEAWRYDPVQDRLKIALGESLGTEFVRTRSGDIVVHSKNGPDLWSYIVLKWKKERLFHAYVIEEKMGDVTECIYQDVSNPEHATSKEFESFRSS